MDVALEALLAQPGAHAWAALERQFGRAACRTALDRGDMVRVARGLMCGAVHVDSIWTAAQGLVLACHAPAAVTGTAALFLHRCVLDVPAKVTVVTTSPTRVRRIVKGARLLRTVHEFAAIDIRGFPVVDPATALVHAVGQSPVRQARATAIEALSSGLIDPGAVAEQVRTRRFRGRAVLRDALAAFDVGVRSILEYDGLTQVLTGDEFAHLLRQHAITVQGRSMLIDAYDARARMAFEFDGAAFHTGLEQWQRDHERDTLLATIDIQTVRFTFRDVRDRPQWCRRRALEVLACREIRVAA